MGHPDTRDAQGSSYEGPTMVPTSSSLAQGDLVLTPPGSLWLTPSPSPGHLSGSCPFGRCRRRARPCSSPPEEDGIDISNSLIILRLSGY